MSALMASNPNRSLADSLVEQLLELADAPPTRPKGMPESFVDGLERVGKKYLKKEDECPICAERFLDDPHPLVVRLPCNDKHMFDLECIQPWLRLNSTCPLDRRDLAKRKEVEKPEPKEKDEEVEEEEEYDDMYG